MQEYQIISALYWVRYSEESIYKINFRLFCLKKLTAITIKTLWSLGSVTNINFIYIPLRSEFSICLLMINYYSVLVKYHSLLKYLVTL